MSSLPPTQQPETQPVLPWLCRAEEDTPSPLPPTQRLEAQPVLPWPCRAGEVTSSPLPPAQQPGSTARAALALKSRSHPVATASTPPTRGTASAALTLKSRRILLVACLHPQFINHFAHQSATTTTATSANHNAPRDADQTDQSHRKCCHWRQLRHSQRCSLRSQTQRTKRRSPTLTTTAAAGSNRNAQSDADHKHR